jgi:hypothetical protein
MVMAATVMAGALMMVALAVMAVTMGRHGHDGHVVPAAMVAPSAMMAAAMMAAAMVAAAGVMATDMMRHRSGRDAVRGPEAGIQGQSLLETIHGRAELPSLIHFLSSPESGGFVAGSPGRPRSNSVSGGGALARGQFTGFGSSMV